MLDGALRHNFIIFQCFGLWQPINWPKGWKTKLYNLYTIFIVIFITTVTISEFIDLIGSIDDVEAFANNSFILMTMVSIMGKGANILKKRYELIGLANVLENYPCQPNNNEETMIQRKFDEITRFNALRYALLTGAGVTVIVSSSIVEDIPRRTLPFKTWLPYNHSDSYGYWIAYIHQVSAHVSGAAINVAFDTLIPGFMLITCGQLNILKHRIHQIPEQIEQNDDNDDKDFYNSIGNIEAKKLAECVKHHLVIFKLGINFNVAFYATMKFAKTSNDVFSLMIFLQYTVSTIVLCVSVFQLSKLKLFSPEFTSIFMYIVCMSVQVYQFCFYGSEMIFESISIADGIYDMDWTPLNVETKRSLIVFMMCTRRPIQFTSCSLLTLNLDSFNSLVKLSYSAFNFLQQSS